jgi:hypothetical protein
MSKTIYNKDINTPEEMAAQFPQLLALLNHSEFQKEFQAPERIANL